MKNCYINGAACISAQKTFETAFLKDTVINRHSNIVASTPVDYTAFLAPAAGRRMAKGIKNGIAASGSALREAGISNPDAIITGTGMGCNIDSDKFLQSLLDNNEEFLTPTSFIQSTHNTVGSQIALHLQCNGYNFTYVNGAVSFESALIDAKLQIEAEEASNILVGGIEELSENISGFDEFSGSIKSKSDAPYSVLNSETKGAVFSEGAVFFVLSGNKQDSTYAQIKDVAIFNSLEKDEVAQKIEIFLRNNGYSIQDIDVIGLGYNGDVEYDSYYTHLADTMFDNMPQVYYKHLSGEFYTASSFGLWVAANICKLGHVPEIIKANAVKAATSNTILLYNQYKGRDHSFTLITKP
jgi:3-oxoacyl-(acyl-carrier-protein) synthase